jgi:hypothetical protein
VSRSDQIPVTVAQKEGARQFAWPLLLFGASVQTKSRPRDYSENQLTIQLGNLQPRDLTEHQIVTDHNPDMHEYSF